MKISYILPIVGVSAIIAYPFQSIYAQSAKEVGRIAEAITVRIDGQNPGSGVLIKRQGDTYTVLTAAHVVETEDEYEVITSDEKRYKLNYSQVKKFPKIDLALVEFDSPKTYQIADLGDSNEVKAGEKIYVSGFPTPTEAITESIWNFSSGSITANAKRSLEDGYSLVYDNNTLSGMSGGAILNEKGQLIGIHGRADAQQHVQQTGIIYIKSGFNLGISSNTFVNLVHQVEPTLELKPGKPVAKNSILTADDWYLRGVSKAEKRKHKGAIADFNKAIQRRPDYAEAFQSRGLSHSHLGNYEKAIDDYAKVIEFKPDNAQGYGLRGTVYYLLGHDRKAIKDFTRYIQIDPDYVGIYIGRAFARYHLGDDKNAERDLEKATQLTLDNSANSYLLRTYAHQKLGHMKNALKDINQAIQLQPDNASAYNRRAKIYKDLGNPKQVLADYGKAIQLQPSNASFYIDRGTYRYELKDKKGARADYTRVIKLRPENRFIYLTRSLFREKLGDLQGAINDLDTAIEKASNFTLAYYSRGSVYEKLGQIQKAVADYRVAARLYQDEGDHQMHKQVLMAIETISEKNLSKSFDLTPQKSSTSDRFTNFSTPFFILPDD